MLEIIDLSKKYNSRVIIEKFSICMKEKKFYFLLGKNGAGKTSFFKCILNLEGYEGTILYENKPFDSYNDKVFAIYDDTPLYTNLTGNQNIKIFTDKTNFKNMHNSLITIDLNKKVKYYSYGEKKKLSIIIAILLKPKFLIIDEISNGLDYDCIKWLQKNLKLVFKDSTIIGSGHQFDFYDNLIDEILVINNHHIEKLPNTNDRKELRMIYEENFS
ncbi:MAG: ATP-binding cassette domain-containing protein [Terrisporobacter sp.]